jgi:hypothetical protein
MVIPLTNLLRLPGKSGILPHFWLWEVIDFQAKKVLSRKYNKMAGLLSRKFPSKSGGAAEN